MITSIDSLDEDGRQEYLLTRLLGHGNDEALRRGGRADNYRSSARQLRTRTLMFDWLHNKSLLAVAVEDRPMADIEAEFDRREVAAAYLDYCTPTQREVLQARYGFVTGDRKSHREVAEMFGRTRPQWSYDHEQRGLARIRRALAKPSLDEATKQRLARKRELNRQWMAQNRAKQKAAA